MAVRGIELGERVHEMLRDARNARDGQTGDNVSVSPPEEEVFTSPGRLDPEPDREEVFTSPGKLDPEPSLPNFGPGLTDAQITKLIEQDIKPGEFQKAIGGAHSTFNQPGVGPAPELMSAFLNSYVDLGSSHQALNTVRQGDAYKKVFRGNVREDGTIRMNEQDYFGYQRGWQRMLLSHGLDPQLFDGKGRFVEAVEGEVSIDELEARLQATQDGIIGNMEEVKGFYAENYELRLTDEAILGAAIDPEIQTDLLERRITAAQVGGEARLQGFARGVERAEQLAAAGLRQEQARGLYSEAAGRVPTLDALSRRHNDPRGEFGIGGFEDAAFLGDAEARRRMDRRMQDESSQFSTRQGARRDQQTGGLTGLRQR